MSSAINGTERKVFSCRAKESHANAPRSNSLHDGFGRKLDAPCAEIGMNLSNEDYNSQEEALEEGLQEALQIIIKNKDNEQRN